MRYKTNSPHPQHDSHVVTFILFPRFHADVSLQTMMHLHETDTVAQVKAQLTSLHGVTFEDHHLTFGQETVTDDAILGDLIHWKPAEQFYIRKNQTTPLVPPNSLDLNAVTAESSEMPNGEESVAGKQDPPSPTRTRTTAEAESQVSAASAPTTEPEEKDHDAASATGTVAEHNADNTPLEKDNEAAGATGTVAEQVADDIADGSDQEKHCTLTVKYQPDGGEGMKPEMRYNPCLFLPRRQHLTMF